MTDTGETEGAEVNAASVEDPRVAGALGRLDDVPEAALAARAEIYADVYRRLNSALTESDRT